MNTRTATIAAYALAAILSLSGAIFSVSSVGAQNAFPTTDPATQIGGTGAFGTTTGVLVNPTPTVPGTGTGTGSFGTPGPSLSKNSYCAGFAGNRSIFLAGSTVGDLVKFVTCFIQDLIIPLLFVLAFAAFIWGMVKFIMSQQSAEREDGKQFMLWGVIALAVMFSVWGLVKIFQDTFQVKNAIPQLTVPNGK